ncbi:Succinate-semialdehyde dehydrogenase, mitochondrial [Araneus ventricosus]|uniref:Succinate-semialdehyde dehydrogenase, mitochondrial n=1 Tax=Araneus ventricosus TaxID=182803 RepID=A0A4Y2DJG5_ARAVE|nr:Succinate-semialdehyde dehydrogenase, mitochondrial [Araneus ventricosus]
MLLKHTFLIKNRFKCIIQGWRRIHDFSVPDGKTYINGSWVAAKNGKTFPVFNPANGETVANVPDCGIEETNEAVDGCYDAFKTWKNTTAKERAAFLRRMFELQMKNSNSLARIITLEGGKTLTESVGEISYGASFFEWFSEEARRIYGDIVPSPFKNRQLFFFREPIGVAGIITPWNFPNAMITRKVAAALAAGCTCVIKPAEDTPLSALAIAQLAEEAKIPPGVINVITTSRNNTVSVGKRLCEHTKVATISFTGSTAVGKLLFEQSASTVKRVSLELGGNAPFIVFNSADVSKAVTGAMASKFRNSGQTCVCTNRILVQEKIHDEFVTALGKAMQNQLKVGEGLKPDVTTGPLINENAVRKFPAVISSGAARSGGTRFSSEERLHQIANSTQSGLSGYFFSGDISQIWRVAKSLEVGMVGVNEGIFSCAEAAFGGVKESGLGREGSRYGIDEYVQIKYMCLGGLD